MARLEKDRCGPDERDFALGRLMAFHEMSLSRQQALAFGIGLEELGIADLDPEGDLV